MPSLVSSFISGSFGQFVFRSTVKPILHLYRRLAHHGIPADHLVATVNYRGKSLNIRQRRHNGSDNMAVAQCFHQNQYDFPVGVHGQLTQRRYEDILASGAQPLIIDCGANIGASVLWFSARYPKAHIVAIEPAADNFELLCINAAGLDVDLRQAGIAPVDRESHLDGSFGKAMGYRTNDHASGPVVQMLSIATILAEKAPSRYVPFLLKIDIEGAEKPLFAGDCSAISLFPLIILEPHDWLIPGQRTSSEFFAFHAAAGREFCMKDENIASIAFDSSLAEAKEGFSNSL
jgi:FkbM family methyltransferase